MVECGNGHLQLAYACKGGGRCGNGVGMGIIHLQLTLACEGGGGEGNSVETR